MGKIGIARRVPFLSLFQIINKTTSLPLDKLEALSPSLGEKSKVKVLVV
jgi:hypothetical protein